MARFGDEPDVELAGRLIDNGSAKAYHFAPDFGQEDELWIPRSQSTWVPDPDGDGAGIMFVKSWLANKNGWTNA
jgi:hypothetical protein